MDRQQELIKIREEASDPSSDEDGGAEKKEYDPSAAGTDLEDENLYPKGQLRKKQIHEFLQGIVDHKISTKALVDTKLQEEVTMIGRPNVEGSSKKQMRLDINLDLY